nr:hypothetical protein [Pandoravirus belohorizontensis]
MALPLFSRCGAGFFTGPALAGATAAAATAMNALYSLGARGSPRRVDQAPLRRQPEAHRPSSVRGVTLATAPCPEAFFFSRQQCPPAGAPLAVVSRTKYGAPMAAVDLPGPGCNVHARNKKERQ